MAKRVTFRNYADPEGVRDLEDAQEIDIIKLSPNPFQPRRAFEAGDLDELAASMRRHGVLQSLLVRPAPDDPDAYQIAVGERRWRAAQLAGLSAVPCLVRGLDDDAMEEIALDENIHRKDLNPADEAEAFRRMMERRGLSLRDMAERIGKSHEYVAQRLRILDNPDITEIVRTGLPLSVALSIDRCAEPARGAFIERARAGDAPSLSEVRGARTAQGQASLSKVLTASPPLPSQEPHVAGVIEDPTLPRDETRPDAMSSSWDAPVSKVLTPAPASSMGVPVTGAIVSPQRRGDAPTQETPIMIGDDAPQEPSSKVLTPGRDDVPKGDGHGVRVQNGEVDSPRAQVVWVRAEDVRSFVLLRTGNGGADLDQLRAALWADLEALGG